jgi:hypothetical protein
MLIADSFGDEATSKTVMTGKPCSARRQLVTLKALNSTAQGCPTKEGYPGNAIHTVLEP